MAVTPEAALRAVLPFLVSDPRRDGVAVAVSGGADSTALLHLVHAMAGEWGLRLHAVTVDHGLRPGSAEEAREVARGCAALGVPHATLRWEGWTGRGNLQAAAREARRDLIDAWAGRDGVRAVLLGHTADDEAETMLLRLARGSGVDGLSGIGTGFATPNAVWDRPLLPVTRASLRAWLTERGIGWIEDPSNADPRFDRARARAMMGQLAGLGLTVRRLQRTAELMWRARVTLGDAAAAWADRHARTEGGDLLLDRTALLRWDGDTVPRVLAAAVGWVGGAAPYRPRWEALMALKRALARGQARTLGGCLVAVDGDAVRVRREPRAVEGPSRAFDGNPGWLLWDGRWSIRRAEGAAPYAGPPLRVAALGRAGLGQLPPGAAGALPEGSLLCTPGLWDGDRLAAAPAFGPDGGWAADLRPRFRSFARSGRDWSGGAGGREPSDEDA